MGIRTYAQVALLMMTFCMPAHADSGTFVGASIGSASLNEDFDALTIDDASIAFRIVGGWQVNDYFALEAGYNNFGDLEQVSEINGIASSIRLSADGFTLGVNGGLPLKDRFSLIGRAGVFFWNGTAEINDVSQASPDDTNRFLGVGASYDVNERFSITADWTSYELESANSEVYSIGFEYRLGQ